MVLKISDFDYDLPPGLIAQTPLENRDASKLLVMSRGDGSIVHRQFSDIVEYLSPGDVLVINNTRVLSARLLGYKTSTGGKVEILLLDKLSALEWRVLVGGKRIFPGVDITIRDRSGEDTDLNAVVLADQEESIRTIRFSKPVEAYLSTAGHTPLPPYIKRELADSERYQTVYARNEGSAAAPTAGLHFTPELLIELRQKGVIIEEVTLHVGLDTFKPVSVENVGDHTIHSETIEMNAESARRINEAKLSGKRIIAVGTTSVRVLETAAWRSAGWSGSLSAASDPDPDAILSVCAWRPVQAVEGPTDLYIYPGYQFRIVDAMVTNFHLPKTSLLLMVSAFAGWHNIKEAYQSAILNSYRFYSFGDAMLLI
ncbi:MAG: tRNA preQ1(34) S-adenosylmethionine ribosyltransferase-isomerase QueA [Candidatus Promineifilaceae bacterium]